MTLLKHALAQAAQGRYVFPLRPGTKKPYKDFHWPVESTTNPDIIREWFKKWPKANYGIDCGKSGLAVIDEDVKDGKVGDKTLVALELDHEDLPPTETIQTPSGGRQLYFSGHIPSTVSDKGLGLDVDTRGRGGYVVGLGSIFEGNAYTITTNGTPVAPVPSWVVDLLAHRISAQKKAQTPLVELDQEHHITQAIAYLEQAEGAVQGAGGDAHTLTVAAKLKDLGISEDTAVELMLEHWDDRCSPPWGPDGIALKARNAYRHCTDKAPGEDTAEAVFADIADDYDLFGPPIEEEANFLESDDPPVSNHKQLLAWMNHRHAVVVIKGKTRITTEITKGDQIGTNLMPVNDFYASCQQHKTIIGQDAKGNDKFGGIGKWWFDQKKRWQPKDGIGFWPPGADIPADCYNMWTGFVRSPSTPDQSKFAKYTYLVEQIICGGNPEYIAYMWTWLAHMVQCPGRGKPKVAIILKGRQGTGKGTFVRPFQAMFGKHAKQVTQQKYLTGGFNAHLADKVLVFADEAVWAGDKQMEGPLKGLITEPTLNIERKGIDSYDMPSYHFFIFASNESWVVPASLDARRFFVLELSDERIQDSKWFGELKAELRNGGTEALMAWLMAYDISKVDLYDVPKTRALMDQKDASLPAHLQWWQHVLEEGVIGKGGSWGDEDDADADQWTRQIPRTEILESYQEYCQLVRCRYPMAPKKLFAFIRKAAGWVREPRPKINEQRVRCLKLPPLEECEERFIQIMAGKVAVE